MSDIRQTHLKMKQIVALIPDQRVKDLLTPHLNEMADPVAQEIFRKRASRQANRVLDAEERGTEAPLDFFSEQQLLDEPPAPELVSGMLVQGSLFMLFGPKNLGKTFLTIALGYAVAIDGQQFLDRSVTQHGDVVLVLAEGGSRLGLRLRAWRQEHGVSEPCDRLHVLKQAVNLTDPEAVESFIEVIRIWQPKLVIFDTLSRCMAGAVENAAEDMSMAVGNLDKIRAAIPGVTVGVVHHPTKASDDVERGAGTFANALDTVINASQDTSTKINTITSKYCRDLDHFVPIQYSLDAVILDGLADRHGRPLTSAVVRRMTEDAAERAREEASRLDAQIVDALNEQDLSGAELAKQLKRRDGDVLAACRRLKVGQRIKSAGKKWRLAESMKTASLLDFSGSRGKY